MGLRGRTDQQWWGVVLDAPDPAALAGFYADLLGWKLRVVDPSWATVAPPADGTYLGFHRNEQFVPPVWPSEPNSQQQMLHLDIEVVDLDAAVEDAVSKGARPAAQQPQPDVRVMLDPVGHPFCLYLDPSLRDRDSASQS